MPVCLGGLAEHVKTRVCHLDTPLIVEKVMGHEGDAEKKRSQQGRRKAGEAQWYLPFQEPADAGPNGIESAHLNSVMLIAPPRSPSAPPSFG